MLFGQHHWDASNDYDKMKLIVWFIVVCALGTATLHHSYSTITHIVTQILPTHTHTQ